MRGKASNVGDTRIAPNGYHNTRTESGWRLTHHIIMEQTLGRPLRPDERVTFKDGKRTNLKPSNIVVQDKGRTSLRRRLAALIARRDDIQAEIDDIEAQLRKV